MDPQMRRDTVVLHQHSSAGGGVEAIKEAGVGQDAGIFAIFPECGFACDEACFWSGAVLFFCLFCFFKEVGRRLTGRHQAVAE